MTTDDRELFEELLDDEEFESGLTPRGRAQARRRGERSDLGRLEPVRRADRLREHAGAGR